MAELRGGINDAAQFIVEPPDLFSSHLPEALGSKAPRLVDAEGGSAWSFEEGALVDQVGLEVASARLPGIGLQRSYRYDQLRPSATVAAERLAEMDGAGVDRAAIFPTYGLNAVNIGDDELHRACVRAYNDGVLEWCAGGDRRRLLPHALIPASGLDDAVGELERVLGLGFGGIVLTGWPSAQRTPSPEDDPFWARCAEAQTLLSIVRGGTTAAERSARLPTPSTVGRYAAGVARPEHPVPIESLITDLVVTKNQNLVWLILTGVLDRFPDLRVLLVLSGSGWLPTCGELIDWNYRYAQFVPGNGFARLKDVPSDYLRHQTYVTVEPDQRDVGYLRQRDCADKVLWASGFPTSISPWPDVKAAVAEQCSGLDDGLPEAFLRGNFDALYAPAGSAARA